MHRSKHSSNLTKPGLPRVDSSKLQITDCTIWSRASHVPSIPSDDAHSLATTHLELGPIAELPQKTSQPSVSLVSALMSEKSDFDQLPTHVARVSVLLSASDGHSIKLLRRNKMKQLRHLHVLCEQARELRLPVRCYLMCAFSSPFEGKTSPHELSELCARLLRFGCEDVILVDNEGTGDTETLRAMLNVLTPQLPKARTGFYFSGDNPETEGLVKSTKDQGFKKFCATQHGGLLIGSEKQSSIKIADLLIY